VPCRAVYLTLSLAWQYPGVPSMHGCMGYQACMGVIIFYAELIWSIWSAFAASKLGGHRNRCRVAAQRPDPGRGYRQPGHYFAPFSAWLWLSALHRPTRRGTLLYAKVALYFMWCPRMFLDAHRCLQSDAVPNFGSIQEAPGRRWLCRTRICSTTASVSSPAWRTSPQSPSCIILTWAWF